jgi:hypothetical protein
LLDKIKQSRLGCECTYPQYIKKVNHKTDYGRFEPTHFFKDMFVTQKITRENGDEEYG